MHWKSLGIPSWTQPNNPQQPGLGRASKVAMKNQNGNPIAKNVRQEPDGSWGCNVWFGQYPPTNLRRNFYETRKQARRADISDDIGEKTGLIRIGAYASGGDAE